MRTRTIFMLLLPVLLAGCSLVSNEPDEAGEIRIIAGQSIDGISVGDDSAAVVQKLGAPTSTLTGEKGQVTLRYTQGKHAGLDVVLARDSTGSHVHRVSAHAPYEGRSKEGVGIGTGRDAVLATWAEPERANDLDSLRYDLYFYDDVFLGVETHGGKVTHIDMEGLVEDPRIVWGESIEGVKLGDDSLTVIEKLGEPTGMGAADGPSGYYYLIYNEELRVGIFDTLGVVSIDVALRYSGKTREGIGLQSRRGDVLRRMGRPSAAAQPNGINVDSYGFDSTRVVDVAYSYRGDDVETITLLYGSPRHTDNPSTTQGGTHAW